METVHLKVNEPDLWGTEDQGPGGRAFSVYSTISYSTLLVNDNPLRTQDLSVLNSQMPYVSNSKACVN